MTRKISGQMVDDDGVCYHVHIKKPIYGQCVAISDAIIKEAETHHRLLLLTCPGAQETISPADWMRKSKVLRKVFRYPDNPMVLWIGTIGKLPDEKRVEQLSLI